MPGMHRILFRESRRDGKSVIFIGDYHLSLANVLLTLANMMLVLVVILMLRREKKEEKDDEER